MIVPLQDPRIYFFQKWKAVILKLEPKTCNFFKTVVKTLGHIVGESGPTKLKCISIRTNKCPRVSKM